MSPATGRCPRRAAAAAFVVVSVARSVCGSLPGVAAFAARRARRREAAGGSWVPGAAEM